MRKIVLNTLLFVLVLFLSGCNFEKKEKEKISSKLDELITNFQIESNFELPSKIKALNKEYEVIWSSSNDDIVKIINDGSCTAEIRKTHLAQDVQIKAEVKTENNEIISKTYTITILADPLLVSQIEDDEYVNNFLNELVINKEITENFYIPSKITTRNTEYDIEWISSNQEIISFEKEENVYNILVNRALDDKKVQITALVNISEDKKIEKIYDLLVKQSPRAEGLKEEFVKWHNNRDSEALEKLTKENVFVSYLYYMDENIIVCNLNNEVHHFLGIYEPWKCEGLEFNMAGLVYFVWDGNNLYEIDVAYNKGLISKDILAIVHKNIYPQFYE